MKKQQWKFRYLSIFVIAVTCVIALLEIRLVPSSKIMSGVYTVPYFSGAANTNLFSGHWMFDPDYADSVKDKSLADLLLFQFPHERNSEKLRSYAGFNNAGLLYLIILAHGLTPFLGQMGSLVLLQLLVFFFICINVLRRIADRRLQWLFSVIFCWNPLIVFIVIMPYYYFWQLLPAFFFILFWYAKGISISQRIIVTILSFLLFFIRPTTLGISMLNVFLAWGGPGWHWKRIMPPLAFLLILAGISKLNSNAVYEQPWHTAVAGLGAYPNRQFEAYPGDDFVINTFNNITGDSVNTSFHNGKLYDRDFRLHYYNVLKTYYFGILTSYPLILVRNAFLNVTESFSFGYRAGHTAFNLLSAFIGLCICILLVIKRQYMICIAIFLGAITYTLYYPPLATYMFGNYLLLAFGCISVLSGENAGKRGMTRHKILHARMH